MRRTSPFINVTKETKGKMFAMHIPKYFQKLGTRNEIFSVPIFRVNIIELYLLEYT